ncbi:hypothetical protein [Pseudomonas sp. LRF_L74]|uniref:hypothetical protein n=1 Tax=Pseudomonas sp. LRF_L74 TaxID=3369422 RepID=UPI003F629466
MTNELWLTLAGAIIGSFLGGIISFAIGLYFFKKSELMTRVLQFIAYNAESQYIEKNIAPLEKDKRSKRYYFERPTGQNEDIPHLHKVIVIPHKISVAEVRAGRKVSAIFQITDNGNNFDCANATSATHEYGKQETIPVRDMNYGWMHIEIPVSKTQSPKEYFITLKFSDGKYQNESRISYHVV